MVILLGSQQGLSCILVGQKNPKAYVSLGQSTTPYLLL